MRQAVKMEDYQRQLRLNMKLKDLVFDKIGSSFAIQNCPILKEREDWAAEKLLGREKARTGMMRWTDGDIHSHLTTMGKEHKKAGKELFKQIQVYMTDRASNNQTQDEVGLAIVNKGHSQTVFRNEIYCQLIKQLTANEKPQSVSRGWNLLIVCLYVFPPSRELENYLEVFIRNQSEERRDRPLVALHSILYSANAGMRRAPTAKDMQDILEGLRPIKRDFLDTAPEAPAWAPLTVSFHAEQSEEAEEYFESAQEPLAGAVPAAAAQKRLNNTKHVKKNPGMPPANPAAQFNFGQKLDKQEKAPPVNPMQQQKAQLTQAKAKQKAKQTQQKKVKNAIANQMPSVPPPMTEQKEASTDYVWLCHLDADSGDVFYERISDGTTTWDRPSEPVKPHWLAHLDTDSGELYFENIDSGETVWERPDEFSDPDEQWIARRDPESGDHYYEHIESQKTQWDPPACFKEKQVDQEWLRHFDPTSGEYYYENLRTNETTWDKPAGVEF